MILLGYDDLCAGWGCLLWYYAPSTFDPSDPLGFWYYTKVMRIICTVSLYEIYFVNSDANSNEPLIINNLLFIIVHYPLIPHFQLVMY